MLSSKYRELTKIEATLQTFLRHHFQNLHSTTMFSLTPRITLSTASYVQPRLGQPKNEKLSQEKSTATRSCINIECFHFKVQGCRPLRCKGCPKSASSPCPWWVFSSTPRRPCQQDNGRAPAMQPRSDASSKVINHLQVLGYLTSRCSNWIILTLLKDLRDSSLNHSWKIFHPHLLST